MKRILIGIGVLVCGLSAALLAHDSLDAQGPFPAPSLSLNGGGTAGFTQSGMSLLGWVPVSDIDPTHVSGNDCWGYTSGSGREYAIIGTSDGTAFIEVTDPGAPSIVAVLASPNSLWRDVKTYQDYAYAVSEGGGGIQVFDMSAIDSGSVTLASSITGFGCSDDSHNVAIDEVSGYLYRLGGTCGPCSSGAPQGMVIYDLSTPASPSYVTTWSTQYVHDAQIVTWDLAGPYFGRELAFCAANDNCGGGSPTLTILDVTNKAAIATLGMTSYSSSAFSHQCWLSEDKQFVYLNDELDESTFGTMTTTRVIDVGDPSNPFQVGTFSSGVDSIDHNLYVANDLVFEANYRSGLRVFDATTPTSPTEIAWFDTYPADDDAQFNSLWSVYPYFASGTIVGSDLEKGLFVWRLGDRTLDFSYPDGLVTQLDPAGGGRITFQIAEALPGDLDPGSVAMFVDVGAGFVSVPVTDLGGLKYESTFPGASCGDVVRYYVSARSQDGVTWTDPPAGPTQVHLAQATLFEKVPHSDDLEVDLGWVVGDPGDTATTGIWTRVDPIGTAAQPEDDHTEDPAVFCFVTGQGSIGGSVGDDDVDGGITTLFSPSMDASGLDDPLLRYWRWFSNNQGGGAGEDTMVISISNDDGSSWVTLETVGPTGPDATGGWIQHTARIADFVTPTSQMMLRFVAGDLNNGSIVEAAVDDLCIVDNVCTIALTSLSPAAGAPSGGQAVTITGQGFVDGVTTVAFGTQPSPSVTVLDENTLVAVVPPAPRGDKRALVRGRVDVTVTTGPGSATKVGGYTYREALKPR